MAAIATAIPRRRWNQCEVSAISGPKVAEAPKPTKICAIATSQRLGDEAGADIADAERGDPEQDRRNDAEAVGEPAKQGVAEGESRPSPWCKGSEASARVAPKSACTAGKATTNDHMPTLPTVPSTSATPSRSQA